MVVKPGPVLDFLCENQNVKHPDFIDWTKAKSVLKNLRIKVNNLEFKISGLSDNTCRTQKDFWSNPFNFLLGVKVQNQCNEIVDPGLQSLSWGPSNKATSYPIYKVNGYTFHTLARSKGRKTDNTGVSVKGDIGNGKSDWFGVLEDILELEYTGSDSNRVVLFKCQWYDPSRPNGTRIHNEYKITEVNHSKRYRHYDPFIVAQKAKQVYFLPYPGNCKSMWHVVVNTKPRGRIEINHVHVEEDEEENDVAYQADESNPSRISDTEPPISLKSPFGEDRIVELSIGSSSGANKNDDDDVADFNDDIDF
ncbi:uncharacterized protein [Arachis hypogaea]|uniref:uncharacterized protein isoform X2 n=1 Tax=Arachis hypogaea TaxID=3818 RepID=UPI003B220A3D